MKHRKVRLTLSIACTVAALSTLDVRSMSGFFAGEAHAADGMIKGPNVVAPDRYVYSPGTEVLAQIVSLR